LLRLSTVKLQDPRDPTKWGTGFFVASDVLLTCWHVVKNVQDQVVLVQQHLQTECSDQGLRWMDLGEAKLLEACGLWDLALLKFTSPLNAPTNGRDTPELRVVLPLGDEDPSIGIKLATTAFPEDGGGAHDATYEASGRTTPEGQHLEFLRIKSDGVVRGFSGSALLDLSTKMVCGVIARNQLPGGASDGGQAIPIGVFRSAFPIHGESVLERNSRECHPELTDLSNIRNLPKAWELATYRAEKREGFVGREWLFDEVRDWATSPNGEQALLICADYGVGKTAFLSQLVETERAGLPIAAYYFCTTEQADTLKPGLFVRRLAKQLAESLPTYSKILKSVQSIDLQRWLDDAENDPARAFEFAVLDPLLALNPVPEPKLLVIDALDEAEVIEKSKSTPGRLSIVSLLSRYAKRLPSWLKVLATSRHRPDVLKTLQQSFSLKRIDAEGSQNISDLRKYAFVRCSCSPLSLRLASANLSPEEVADYLSSERQSSGKFLYVAYVINDVASGLLSLEKREDLQALPAGLEEFYRDSFERRLPNPDNYSLLGPILAVLAEAREPLTRGTIAAIVKFPEVNISQALRPVHDLLRLRRVPMDDSDQARIEVLHSFDHPSLKQWLSDEDEWGYSRSGRFAINRQLASEQIRLWSLAEIESERVHNWTYLVRHLPSHLLDIERPLIMERVLVTLPWLLARLRLAGLNSLLGDFQLVRSSIRMVRLERALRQSAHVISNDYSPAIGVAQRAYKQWMRNQKQGHYYWDGQDQQLASQLLARLVDDGSLLCLREETAEWLSSAGGVPPVVPSLKGHDALILIIEVGSPVSSLITLSDGSLVSSSSDGSIRIWDPSSGSLLNILQTFPGNANSLCVLDDGHIVLGSTDGSIRVWNPKSEELPRVFEGHQGSVNALVSLPNGCFASGSSDKSIRIWNPTRKSSTVLEFESEFASFHSLAQDRRKITCLSAISDEILVSGSRCGHVLLWNLEDGDYSILYHGFQTNHLEVSCIESLSDGRIVFCTIDNTIRVVDFSQGRPTEQISQISINDIGHIWDIKELPNKLLAIGTSDRKIILWSPMSGTYSDILTGHTKGVLSLVSLPDGKIASGSGDGTIRIWDYDDKFYSALDPGHKDRVNSFAVLSDGRIASSSAYDHSIHIWDQSSGSASVFLEGSECEAWSLAVLADGRLACGFMDLHDGVKLWDLAIGKCTSIFTFQSSNALGVHSFAVISDNYLACGLGDGSIHILDTTDKRRLKPLKGIQRWAKCLSKLMRQNNDATPNNLNCKKKLHDHTDWVWSLAVLNDGRLVSGSEDKTIRLWDLEMTSSMAFTGHEDGVVSLTILADGQIASASKDRTIRIWDPASGNSIVFEGHLGCIWALVALRDGRFISGSADKTILIWDPSKTNGAPRLLFVADAPITSLTLVRDSNLLLAGDASGRVHWLRFTESSSSLQQESGQTILLLPTFHRGATRGRSMLANLPANQANKLSSSKNSYEARIQRIVEQAKIEASRLGQSTAGTEHLLLALIAESYCRTSIFLHRSGTNLKLARTVAAEKFGMNSPIKPITIELTPKADAAVSRALEILSTKRSKIQATEVLAISLIKDGPNAAIELLKGLAINTNTFARLLRKTPD
jgi:WD40 repeat protein